MKASDWFIWRVVGRLLQVVGSLGILVPVLGLIEPATMPAILTAGIGMAALSAGSAMRALERA